MAHDVQVHYDRKGNDSQRNCDGYEGEVSVGLLERERVPLYSERVILFYGHGQIIMAKQTLY